MGELGPAVESEVECPPRVGIFPRTARAGPARTIFVNPGESIQDAVDSAQPGDTVVVASGTYHESVCVQTDDLTLQGSSQGDDRPQLDGKNLLANAVVAFADGFSMESFQIRNYLTNGVVAVGARGVILRDLLAENTGEYGVYPVGCENVLIERVMAIGASDTGIYVGQSRDVVVRDNEAHANVSGFEIENSVNVLVSDNYAHGNTAGMLVFVLPRLAIKETRDVRLVNNRVLDNNLPNFAEEGSLVSNVPRGIGILILAADGTEVTGNEILGNRSAGVAVVGLEQFLPDQTEFDVGVWPEENWIHDNLYQSNGTDPDPAVAAAGLPGADLLWDTTGWNNAWHEQDATSFPPLLPDRSWPAFMRRAYWRVLNFVASFV
jgi:parallel beta-helix repeat protein